MVEATDRTKLFTRNDALRPFSISPLRNKEARYWCYLMDGSNNLVAKQLAVDGLEPAEEINPSDIPAPLAVTPIWRPDTEAALRVALAQAQEDLKYQELLIHEANHRTNNALQLVMGGLAAQATLASDVMIRIALELAIDRIQQIHEVQTLLSQRTSTDVVDVSLYLQRISQGLAACFAAECVTISVEPDVSGASWQRDIVIPLGLIVAEALTNSLKYAFPDGRSGSIRITTRVEHDGLMRLEIEDDGCGLPAERRAGSLGLGLIERLAQLVHGEATVSSSFDGTLVRVTFPNPCADTPQLASCAGFALPEPRSLAASETRRSVP